MSETFPNRAKVSIETIFRTSASAINSPNLAVPHIANSPSIDFPRQGQRLPVFYPVQELFRLKSREAGRIEADPLLPIAGSSSVIVGTANAADDTSGRLRDYQTQGEEHLSSIEHEAIAIIEALRRLDRNDVRSSILERPERLMRRFIFLSHGNVKLRLGPVAEALGVEMRTLERAFAKRYGESLHNFDSRVRFKYAQKLLESSPMKVSSVAAALGYRVSRDFTRFFQKHAQVPPAEWRRNGSLLHRGQPELICCGKPVRR